MHDTDYATLTEIGSLYGVPARKVGRWLRRARLRDKRGNPINAGLQLTAKFPTPNGRREFYAWHLRDTLAVLEWLGHTRHYSHDYVRRPR
jgi:hypothetical protein